MHCGKSRTGFLANVMWLWVIAGISLASVAIAPQAFAGHGVPGVLILHSNQRPTPAAIVIEDTMRATIPQAFKGPIEIYSEYLDVEVPSSAALAANQVDFLKQKYDARDVRVIVASAPGAMPFALRLREHLARAVPIVHVAVPVDTLAASNLPAFVVGRPVDLDPVATIELALRLHPDAKRVVVVLGAVERDRIWERRVRHAAGRIPDAPPFEYVSGLATDEVLRRVGALDPGAIVFTPGYFTDGAGETVTPRRSVERIAKASAVPVYGALDTFLDSGVVGGSVTPYDAQARAAASIVVRLLDGATLVQIDTSPIAQVPMVDWRQIRRWNVDERLLPAGTIVKYREPSVWERYKLEITILMVVLVLQAVLISALLFERRSRRRTASALEERDAQMKLAASAARLTSWIWDAGRGNGPSPGAHAARAEAIHLDRVMASVHPADRDNLQRAVNDAIATGRELDIEYRMVDPDGHVRWMSARGRAEGGGTGRLLGVALDVTERKISELRATEDRNALRHMTRVSMMGQLSAAIAHQLYQPLTAILGNAETAQKMLRRGKFDVAELEEICGDIVTEDRRATDVIRRLSDLYKRDRKDMQSIDVNGLVRETLDLLRTELVVRQVLVRTELEGSSTIVEGDPVQLQQVILNLVLNAADAMNDVVGDREIVIRTLAEGSCVRMCVIDIGPGIASEEVDTVFNPFWTTKPGGMGMGLAICRSIAAAHRGTITAASNPGRGATFCLSLPAVKPA